MKPSPAKIGLLLGLLLLVILSEHLTLNRMFVVDEFQNVFTARLLATHQAGNFMSSANLLILGPMTWIAGAFEHAAPMMRAERVLFFLLFWLNLALIVRCAGFRLRSQAGALALLFAATFAVFWHYGFEIRHDNPLLTMVLLAWLAARPLQEGARRRPFLVGLFAVIAQFLAFKAFVYTVPIVLFTIVAAWWFDRRPLWRVVVDIGGGALVALAGCRAIYFASGTWTIFATSTQGLAAAAVHRVQRMNPLPVFIQFVIESPILIAGMLIGAVLTIRRWNWRELVSRDSLAPEAAFCLSGIVALLANPSPFPYNLVIPTAQAVVLFLRLRPWQWLSKPVLAALAAVHVGIWLYFTSRHYVMTNERQTEVMTIAEQMTDPQSNRVLDGVGMVTTRLPPNYFWLLTFITLPSFHSGELAPMRSELAKGQTPVIIPNYRVFSLPRADHEFIGQHYVPLSGDYLVAGGRFTRAGVSSWECLVPGRYYVTAQPHKPQVTIDGASHPAGVMTMTRGAHRIDVPPGDIVWIIWLGPTLTEPPDLGPGNTRIVVTFS